MITNFTKFVFLSGFQRHRNVRCVDDHPCPPNTCQLSLFHQRIASSPIQASSFSLHGLLSRMFDVQISLPWKCWRQNERGRGRRRSHAPLHSRPLHFPQSLDCKSYVFYKIIVMRIIRHNCCVYCSVLYYSNKIVNTCEIYKLIQVKALPHCCIFVLFSYENFLSFISLICSGLSSFIFKASQNRRKYFELGNLWFR